MSSDNTDPAHEPGHDAQHVPPAPQAKDRPAAMPDDADSPGRVAAGREDGGGDAQGEGDPGEAGQGGRRRGPRGGRRRGGRRAGPVELPPGAELVVPGEPSPGDHEAAAGAGMAGEGQPAEGQPGEPNPRGPRGPNGRRGRGPYGANGKFRGPRGRREPFDERPGTAGAPGTGGEPVQPAAAPPEAEPVPVFSESAAVGLDAQDGRRRQGGKGAPRPAPLLDNEDHPKLHKVLADAGLGSRRDMEELIVSGRVSVNGQPAHIGQRIAPTDQVRVNARLINRRPGALPPRVLLYHKPPGEISSRDDPGQRSTVFDRLPKLKGSRWVAVGRLDFNTEGLLIFTTSGDLANRLMHPRYGWEREYAVRILGRIEDEVRERLLAGIDLDDGPAALLRVEDIGGDGANHWYRVVIAEGRNREVRRIFEAVGLVVSRLVRIRFGPVGLPRQLARGRWVELADHDVQLLLQTIRKADPTAPAKESGADDDEAERRESMGADDDDGDEHWDDDERQPDFGPLPGDEPAPLSLEQQDDDWQPRSANAHLEGITRLVRKGDGLPRKAGGGGARRARGKARPASPFGDSAGFGAARGAAPFPGGAPGSGGNRRRGQRAGAGRPQQGPGQGGAPGRQAGGGGGSRGPGPGGGQGGPGGPGGGRNRGPGGQPGGNRQGGRPRGRGRKP